MGPPLSHSLHNVRQGSSQKVLCCTFSPDGKWFACGGSDWVVRVYNVSTGKERLVLEGHQGNVNACAFNGIHRLSIFRVCGEVRRV